MLKLETLMAGTGCTKDVGVQWLSAFDKAMAKYGINTKASIAAFLANVGVECARLTVFTENLNYSAAGLAATWPNRYSSTGRAGGSPNDLARRIERKPELIANHTYANRMGNGSVESGDGWKYRGHGPIQLTGKDNYKAFSAASGHDVVSNPGLILQPGVGAEVACWFFKTNGCIELANAGNFSMVVKRINGAAPSPANHGDLRLRNYNACLKTM